MSSKFANRRKPRKIGGGEEEDEKDNGAAPGTFYLLFTARFQGLGIEWLI